MSDLWPIAIRLHELSKGAQSLSLEPDTITKDKIAAALDLIALPAFAADVVVRPWFDGAEISGALRARVTQECGVTLDPFDNEIVSSFLIRCVPAGSSQAPSEVSDLAIEPDADDPPDVLESDVIDLGGYLIEHLALEIDPFPRRPDATFEPVETGARISPFDALRVLKRDGEAH